MNSSERLGCPLNDDAVFDVTRLRDDHPLELHFETRAETLPVAWSKAGVSAVCWRPVASFRLMAGAAVAAIALTPGGRCIGYDRVQRRIRFQSLPIAVAGASHSLAGPTSSRSARLASWGKPTIANSSAMSLIGGERAATNSPPTQPIRFQIFRRIPRWAKNGEPYGRSMRRDRDFPWWILSNDSSKRPPS